MGASPFCDSVYPARKLQDAGAGALVMRSLFEEQIEPPHRVAAGESSPGGLEDFPEVADYQLTPESDIRQVAGLTKPLPPLTIAPLFSPQSRFRSIPLANIKSAKKRARQAVKRNARNASQRSMMRTQVKKVLKAIESKDKAGAEGAYKTAAAALDRSAAKGLIHKNKAARHKSRLSAHVRGLA